MPIGALDKSLGGLLAGTWVNSYFFMIELIMVYRYYTRCRSDPVWLKLVVFVTLLVDTTSTLNHYACVYLYTITHWGDKDYLTRQYWPIPVYLVTTGASAWIVQQFLVYRYWLLSKNKFISPLLAATSVVAFAGSIVTAVMIIQHSTYTERDLVRIPVTIWLVCSAVSDVSIAIILIYTLQHMKTSYRKTNNLIKRLTTLAIQTGSPGSVVATLALIVYLTDTENNISVGIAFSLGRVYALTMLHNLNSRDHIRARTARGGIYDGDATMHLSVGDTILGVSDTGNNRNEAHGIRIHTSAMVTMDDQKADSIPLERVGSNDEASRNFFPVVLLSLPDFAQGTGHHWEMWLRHAHIVVHIKMSFIDATFVSDHGRFMFPYPRSERWLLLLFDYYLFIFSLVFSTLRLRMVHGVQCDSNEPEYSE